jgi:hypothetical protein
MSVLLAPLLFCAQARLDLPDRWVYCPFNLQVDVNARRLESIMRRAAAAGYTGVLLADSKFAKLGDLGGMERVYFRNVERVKTTAAELKLKIVPALFGMGYSGAMLWHDPNLVEALPVRDALFVVRGGVARLEPDPPVAFRAKWDWKDETVAEDWTIVDAKGRNARIVQRVKVRPFRQYHVSVRVRTKDFEGRPQVAVLAGGRTLNYEGLGVKPTQDWTVHHAVFNSLEAKEVGLYLGCWDAGGGTLAWADPKIEEVGLLNLVRRDGAPLTVRRDEPDSPPLGEGKDFEPVVDPNMGVHPWKGEYDVWHEPPVIRAALPDGTRLRVSYHHAVTVGNGQAMICPSEPKTVELLRDEARRIHAAWGADAYFMSHDEIRVLGWDASCARRGLDAGAIVADNVRTCASILREVAPKARIFVWSDMFDPHHNAHENYYLVRGNLAGSWEGLDKDLIIAVWFYDRRDESLKFFSERGHRMLIAGYYDGAPEDVRGWLESARKSKGVTGVMYTTWAHRYGDLERFAKAVEESR